MSLSKIGGDHEEPSVSGFGSHPSTNLHTYLPKYRSTYLPTQVLTYHATFLGTNLHAYLPKSQSTYLPTQVTSYHATFLGT